MNRTCKVTMRDACRWALLPALPAFVAVCTPPDRPPKLVELPGSVVAYLEPDSMRTVTLSRGLWYRYLWSPVGPWAVHLLEADLARCEVGLEVVAAPVRAGRRGGHARVTELVAGRRDGVVAAVNGDFFTPEGTPVGSEVASGRVRTARSRPALAWRPGSGPWMGTARLEGDSVLWAGWSVRLRQADAAAPNHRSPVEVIGGYPELLDAGRRVGDLLVTGNPGFAASRHPRTAVGFDPLSRRLWLVVVDGRQGEYSQGMTLPELADLLEALGATEALNLDGGGSSVMVVRGRALSRPSDPSGERAVVNALLLRRDSGFCRTGPGPGAG